MAQGETSTKRRNLLMVAVVAFMVYVDATIVNIAFPSVQETFHNVSRSSLSWVLNAYNVTFAALLIPAGRLTDRMERRNALCLGLVAFIVTSALCAAAPDVGALIALRVLQAAAAAMLIPVGLGIILADCAPGEQIEAVAVLGAAGGAAAACGPAIGGLLLSASSWRMVFLINVPIGLAILVPALRVKRGRAVLDPSAASSGNVPTLVIAAGVGLIALGISKGQDWHWTAPATLAALTGGLALTVAGWLASRGGQSTVSRNATDDSQPGAVTAANAAMLALAAALYAKILTDVLFLTSVWHYSLLKTGLALTPSPIITAALAKPGARLTRRMSVGGVAAIGAGIYAAGCAWYALRVGPHPSYLREWLPGVVLSGCGMALGLPTLVSMAIRHSPGGDYGTAASVNATARQLGGVLGVAAVIAIVGGAGLTGALGAFHGAWTYGAALAGSTCVGLFGFAWAGRVMPRARLDGELQRAAQG